jgi:hypothetical protein
VKQFAQVPGRTARAILDASQESTLFRKNTTGAARSREQSLGPWPMVSPSLNGSTSQKINKSYGHKSLVHYWRRPRNRRGDRKAALVDGNQVLAGDRKPEAVTKAPGTYL